MTPRDSGQDFDPKHRIIGAVVVVTLAVIFIPMVLGERAPPTAQEPSAAAASTPADNKVAITKVAPVEPAAAPPAPASEAPVPARTVEPTPPPAPKKTTTASPDTKRPTGGWVVQVGTFSSTANATRLERKLRAEGQTVLTERIDLQSGKAVRLRVGPFRDRADALKAQARIRKVVGVQGVVLAYP